MIILGTNSIKDTGYDVDNSCRFNSGDSAYMHKALGTPTSTKIGTLSTWFKRAKLDQEMNLLGAETDTNSRGYLQLDDGTNGILRFWWEEGGTVTNLITNRLFRDTSAWYHVVVAYDTSQSTASNRVKIYINGTQETSFSTETYPGQDVTTCPWNISGYNTSVGAQKGGSGSYGTFFDGYQAETVFIDGQQLAPTEFGEFDSDSPTIWKPKDVSGLTFGNNGFYLDYEDSANLGNVANGGTDFTEVNLAATDKALDTCTNNYCTFNPLINAKGGNLTLSEGNLKLDIGAEAWKSALGTIALNNGKWYWEAKCIDATWWHNNGVFSLDTGDISNTSNPMNQTGYSGFYNADGGETRIDNTVSTGDYGLFAANDILGFYLDCDNNQFTIYKNGSSHVSATNLGTGRTDLVPIAVYYFYSGKGEGEYNFGGCQSFTISSGNTDANGYGNFEYSPTIGGVNYYAINTKNLAEFG